MLETILTIASLACSALVLVHIFARRWTWWARRDWKYASLGSFALALALMQIAHPVSMWINVGAGVIFVLAFFAGLD